MHAYTQDLGAMLVKDVCSKCSVSLCHLPHHRLGDAVFLFRHVANVVSIRVHDGVFVGLLKASTIDQSDTRPPNFREPYIRRFPSSSCRCTTSAEFSSRRAAG